MVEHKEDTLEGLTPEEQRYFQRGRRMVTRHPNGPRRFSAAHRVVYRLTRGSVGGTLMGSPIGLLTTTGRRSGRTRTVPVVYLDDGSRFLVVASNSGLDAPPAWCLNLRADPDAAMRTRAGAASVIGRELADSERIELWPRLLSHNAMWGAYQSCTERQCAVFALEPSGNHGPA